VLALLGVSLTKLSDFLVKAMLAAGDSAFGAVLAKLASELARWLVAVVVATPTGSVLAGGFGRSYGESVVMAFSLALPALLLGIIWSIRDGAISIADSGSRLAIAVLIIAAVPKVTVLVMGLVDAFSRPELLQLAKLPQLIEGMDPGEIVSGQPGLTVAVATGFVVLGCLTLLLELLGRHAAIELVLLFIPIAAVVSLWRPARGWLASSIRVLAALVLAKFVLAQAIGLAVSMLMNRVDSVGATKLALMGVAFLVTTLVSPFLVYRLIPLAELAVAEVGGRFIRQGLLSHPVTAARAGAGVAGWVDLQRARKEANRTSLPYYRGYGPPKDLVEAAKTDPFIHEFLYGKSKSRRRGRRQK
jgi:hypothetical protein